MTLSESWSSLWGYFNDYTTPSKRSEFWWAVLALILVCVVVEVLIFGFALIPLLGALIDIILGLSVSAFVVAAIPAMMALSSRRLIDAGYPSGVAVVIACVFGISLLGLDLLPLLQKVFCFVHIQLISDTLVNGFGHLGLLDMFIFGSLVVFISAFLPSTQSKELDF